MVTHMRQSGAGEGNPDGYFSVNKCMLCIYIPPGAFKWSKSDLTTSENELSQ